MVRYKSSDLQKLNFYVAQISFKRGLMKDSLRPNINKATIGIDIRILAGSSREFILWRDNLWFRRREHRLKPHGDHDQ